MTESTYREPFVTLIERSNHLYFKSLNSETLNRKGQVFTPPIIATFMAKQLDLKYDTISFLDPGAGTGILTGAICDRLIKIRKSLRINGDIYENDRRVLPFLKRNLDLIQESFATAGHSINFNIHEDDFISKNSYFINSDPLFNRFDDKPKYDFIISNPPYYKLSKTHYQSRLMARIIHGQPNIYTFFMALSAALLKERGEMVFITPRSYCSGLYFKKFRKWFLQQVNPVFIHSFESRRETFGNEVLQETVILKAIKTRKAPKQITISISFGSDFQDSNVMKIDYQTIIQPNDSAKIIHIPSDIEDLNILKVVRSWNKRFSDLGFRISTGPVVSFRATKYLSKDTSYDGSSKVPLLWMNHLIGFNVKFPLKRIKKPQTIRVTPGSYKLLLKNQNYVLVKRFSSKEQEKRLYAVFYSPLLFDSNYIGIENHVNYAWKPIGELSIDESMGIMAILNSSLVDRYFRIINGSTQVNASEINNMPFPSYNKVIQIGHKIGSLERLDSSLVNSIVMRELEIPHEIQEVLK